MTGLVDHEDDLARHVAKQKRSRGAKTLFNTIPIVLVGSMAIGLGFTGPVESASATKRVDKPKVSPTDLGKVLKEALAHAGTHITSHVVADGSISTASVPSTYRVTAGDTVSGIAGRFGLATASVLALNGLAWKSIIFPGQVLKLTAGGASVTVVTTTPQASEPSSNAGRYTIVRGDTISAIAAKFHVSAASVLSANGLSATSIIYPGQTVAIPGQPATAARPTPPAAAPAPVAPIAVVPIVRTVVTSPTATPDRYTILAGDTISSIAGKFGLSIQSILSANGLSWSSIIYTGRTLLIPSAIVVPAGGPTTVALTSEMAANARTIIAVGKSLRVNDFALVIALSAAMQESSLRNLGYGDRDSLGLFQQRPSTGWGTPAQVTDTTYASRLFFGGPSNPNAGITRGLLEIPGWQSMTVTQAAQAVQQSAYPDAYAKWETSARVWLDQLT
ncbi:MAG: LysM peptidoglycan-binding domain-containing protein [Terrimesophilobacter sp.]